METNFYSDNPKFHVAVDGIIFAYDEGVLKVLLQKRDFEPFRGEMTLMGGFVQENENVRDAALRLLLERTGIHDVFIKQVGAFGNVDRDPGARVISVAYYALIDMNLCDQELNQQHYGVWTDITKLPHLHFGHDVMVQKAITQLRDNISNSPVGFNLLPPKFTLSQLQSLYEAILGETLDKRNFRKRVAEMPFIEKTELVDKSKSRRGAAVYRFNQEKYDKTHNFKL